MQMMATIVSALQMRDVCNLTERGGEKGTDLSNFGNSVFINFFKKAKDKWNSK